MIAGISVERTADNNRRVKKTTSEYTNKWYVSFCQKVLITEKITLYEHTWLTFYSFA